MGQNDKNTKYMSRKNSALRQIHVEHQILKWAKILSKEPILNYHLFGTEIVL